MLLKRKKKPKGLLRLNAMVVDLKLNLKKKSKLLNCDDDDTKNDTDDAHKHVDPLSQRRRR